MVLHTSIPDFLGMTLDAFLMTYQAAARVVRRARRE